MASARKKARKPIKVTDEMAAIRCAVGDGIIREEVWEDVGGAVVRYNLAFINFELFAGDNGRVLGYDNAHGRPHRHFAGTIEPVESAPYTKVLERFIAEVNTLRRRRKL
jgi:hypothetical protein